MKSRQQGLSNKRSADAIEKVSLTGQLYFGCDFILINNRSNYK